MNKYLIMDCWGADAGFKGVNTMMSTAVVEADSPALAVIKIAPKWGETPLEQKDFGNGAVVISPDPDMVESDGIGLLVIEVKAEQVKAEQSKPTPQLNKKGRIDIDQFLPKGLR